MKKAYRKETVRLLRVSVLNNCNWETTRDDIANLIGLSSTHCDVIGGLQSYRIRWNNAR